MSIVYSDFFPDLTTLQIQQLNSLETLYADWNKKINVVSRKDIENLSLHHVLHSLAIARFIAFSPGTMVMDIGTGGGFPGIPLAIMFPETEFLLVDSIRKKIGVVEAICDSLKLKNVHRIWARAETMEVKVDFIVSRAVTSFPVFVELFKSRISSGKRNNIHNGILYLRGHDIDNEIKIYGKDAKVIDIYDYFPFEFFKTKRLVHLKC